MSASVWEDSLDTPDGVLTTYNISQEYEPDSMQVWINGQLKLRENDDGFLELGNKQVELKEAPLVGDHVSFHYEAL